MSGMITSKQIIEALRHRAKEERSGETSSEGTELRERLVQSFEREMSPSTIKDRLAEIDDPGVIDADADKLKRALEFVGADNDPDIARLAEAILARAEPSKPAKVNQISNVNVVAGGNVRIDGSFNQTTKSVTTKRRDR
jgi:hypothetical protein